MVTTGANIKDWKNNKPEDQNHEYPTGESVPFPYEKPYPQQRSLMDAMLQSLRLADENEESNSIAHVILLESPTGTGKSLSLACASLSWLRYRELVDLKEPLDKERKVDEEKMSDDWLSAWASPAQLAQEKSLLKKKVDSVNLAKSSRYELSKVFDAINLRLERALRKEYPAVATNKKSYLSYERKKREELARNDVADAIISERLRLQQKMRKESKTGQGIKRRKVQSLEKSEEDRFFLQDYHSEDEGICHSEDEKISSSDETGNKPSEKNNDKRSRNHTSRYTLLDGGKLDGSHYKPFEQMSSSKASSVGNVTPGSGVRKIIYAARTHSQLSQFISEVKKTHWSKDVRILALGGRKFLCGNTAVNAENKSEVAVTELCLDLQKGISDNNMGANHKDDLEDADLINIEDTDIRLKTKRTMTNTNVKGKIDKNGKKCPLLASKEAVSTLATHMLSVPSDIEDMAALGKASQTCSYYASRVSIFLGGLVEAQYNLLL